MGGIDAQRFATGMSQSSLPNVIDLFGRDGVRFVTKQRHEAIGVKPPIRDFFQMSKVGPDGETTNPTERVDVISMVTRRVPATLLTHR